MSTDKDNPKMRHQFVLVTGMILFKTADAEEGEVANVQLNGLIKLPLTMKTWGIQVLSKAQHTLQVQFFNRLQHETVQAEVLDIVIQNMINLGTMTNAEFEERPDMSEFGEATGIRPGLDKAHDPFN